MAVVLKNTFLEKFVTDEQLAAIKPEVEASLKTVLNKSGEGSDFTGWVTRPVDYDKEEYARIKLAAEKIRKNCDVFIVIGIGGSYLGARSAIEFVNGARYNAVKDDKTPAIYFSGNSISSSALSELLKICDGKDVSINVVSKSGTTTEPAIAFRVFRELIEKKYGDCAKDHIFITTDKEKGSMKGLADVKGYETFVVPDDIGGRYSVLTAVGLLPIAVAGIDTDAMLKGAENAMELYTKAGFEDNDCLKYAAYRNILYRAGKSTEIFVSYEPALLMLAEWWKQLYGESEGKDGKGLFPASVNNSTDLHSLGQYIQQGVRNLFETVVDVKKSTHTVIVPNDEANTDGFNFLSGKELDYVNHRAMLATLFAHEDGGVPNIVLEADERSAYVYGELVYFFELACGVSGYTLGVNPFNQPGVEAYKKNMFALLGREKAGDAEMFEQLKEKSKSKNITL